MKPKYFIATAFSILCVFLLVLFSTTGENAKIKQEIPQEVNITDQQTTVEKKAVKDPDPTPPLEKQTVASNTSETIKTVQAEQVTEKPAAIAAFDRWLGNYLTADQQVQQDLVAEGVALAELRKPVMEQLIHSDPQAALESAVSYYEFEQLPGEIKELVEKPFTKQANVILIPDHTASDTGPTVFLETTNGEFRTRQLFLYGQRQHMLSKNGIAAQGIILDNIATVYDSALQVITSAEEIAWAGQNLEIGSSNPATDFLTGEPIENEPVMAVAGGKVFYFANQQNVQTLNKKLAELENRIDPDVGSQVLFVNAMVVDGDSQPFAQILQEIPVAASTWTETKKTVFFIRVDFSDMTGASVSKADLLAKLNGDVTDYIDEYSYGKTWIEGEVSDDVIRVPQNSSYYVLASNDPNYYNRIFELRDDAIAAFNALNPGILSAYDIVGVHFAEIGYSWAGLASIGGSRVWIENTLSTSVIVHEFGHNYGLYHANFWDTGGTSVVGTGSDQSYGDIFDNMGSGGVTGHYHMQGKSRLNWMTTDQWTDVVGSGTYRIHRFDDKDANSLNKQALRVQKDTGEYYWVGYRLNYTGNSWLQNGAYMLWQRNSSQSWLIDTTPGSADGKNDAGVLMGATYSDTAANVHITPIAKGGTAPDQWLDVTVNLGDFSGNNDPTVTVSGPATPQVRTPVVFTASGSDGDGDDLAYFWDFGDGVFHESSSSISHTWAIGGTYTVTVTANDMKGGTDTDQMIVTVSDPLTQWNPRTSNTSYNLYDIATDGSQVVVVGRREALTSPDGTNWTNRGSVGTNVYLYGLVHDGSQWIAAGEDYDFGISGWVGTIYTSSNGSSWTNRLYGGPPLNDIATNGTVHVAVGDNGTILSSTNGTSWSSQTSGTTTPLQGIAYGNNTFTAVGAGSGGGPVVVLISTDAINWFDQSSGAGVLSWQGFYNVEYLNDRFVASGWYAKIRHSTDNGATFTTNRTTTEQTPALAYGNNIYFAAGLDRDNSGVDIDLASMDGETWHALTTPSLDDRNSAIFFNSTFITVGNNGAIRQSDPVLVTSIIGDVNQDSQVDITDAIIALQVLSGMTPGATVSVDGDVNGDGNVGHAEAIHALQSTAGLAPK